MMVKPRMFITSLVKLANQYFEQKSNIKYSIKFKFNRNKI